MPPIQIDVRSGERTYKVIVGAGLLTHIARYLTDAGLSDPIVVTPPPVWRHQGHRLEALTGEGGPIMMADGERAKTMLTVSRLYEEFAKRHLTRSSSIVAFGGGVTGDAAGFAAATYLRGLPLVQVPTTLLAQVDSAIGGKVGVNLPSGKNMAGAFHAPALVLCDADVLDTLARREFRAGLYEVVKYGVALSRDLFGTMAGSLDRVFAHDRDSLVPLITACCRIKADVVSRDEREAGPRRVLNFGHTIGHALEAVTRYKRFRHGEAVAYGMLAAARISVKRGAMPAADEAQLQDLIRRMGPLPPVADLSQADVLDATTFDKKISKGRLHFVLSTGLGSTTIVSDVTSAELSDALTSIGLGT